MRQEFLQLRDLNRVAMDDCMQYPLISDRGHFRVLSEVVAADHIGLDIELRGGQYRMVGFEGARHNQHPGLWKLEWRLGRKNLYEIENQT